LNSLETTLTQKEIGTQVQSALEWLEEHAKSGNIYAQYDAANFYLSGLSDMLEEPLVKGFAWLVVVEHNVRQLYSCCGQLKEEISKRLENTAALLTGSEHDQAIQFARSVLRRDGSE